VLTELADESIGMNSLVAFFDILGTRELVKRRQFSDFHSLDFANPAGIAALQYPEMRFAAFSDSVVVSCDAGSARHLLSVLNMLCINWQADFIFVRGGLTLGEITWVDEPHSDKLFRRAENFACARMYGSALVEAFELQEKSGPGAVCFVSEAASRVLEDSVPHTVLRGPTNVLAWPTPNEIAHLRKTFNLLLNETSCPVELRRHVRASEHYLALMEQNGLALPTELSYYERAKAQSKRKASG
jgi:hypothetical protein